MSLAEIRREFGPDGIRDYAPVYGRRGSITDDTQMTLFTAEGLIRARVRHDLRGICNPVAVVRHAYLRWLLTQDEEPGDTAGEVGRDGWLIQVEPLWSRRAPGNTCLAALKDADSDLRIRNNSKGCGGVMRVAPVGLISEGAATAFELGCETARLTHGHPSGYLSAGYLAALIQLIVQGVHVNDAATAAISLLTTHEGHEEVLSAVEKAVELVGEGAPSPEKVETLGSGWVAEEALAIGVYCALATASYGDAVVLAVNHGGDSDSTGSIAGQIMGVVQGVEVVPENWLSGLELSSEITSLAEDLWLLASGQLDGDGPGVWERYPGW